MLCRALRLPIGSLLALSMCLTTASGQGRLRAGSSTVAAPDFDAAGECPTRFDYEVLASAADSGNFLGLSGYRFRRDIRYSTLPLGGLERVVYRPESAATDCRLHGEKTIQQRG